MTNTTEIENQDQLSESYQGSEKSKKIKEDLEQVLLTQKGLDQIKENLNKMVDAMAYNPSFLSRAAAYWGEIPLWQKIIAGIVLTVPIFVIALVAQVVVLLTISIFTAFIFAAASLLLDNHHSLNMNRTEHLKTGITSLANTLGVVILSLDKLREQLSGEIEKFQLENEQLGHNVKELKDQIQDLTEQSKLLKETERALRHTNTELQNLTGTLQGSIKEHTVLLEQNEAQLKQAQLNYEKAQVDLNNKIEELHQVKKGLNEEIEILTGITGTLDGVVTTLTKSLRLTGEEQKALIARMREFLNDKTKSFHEIAERISTSEHELAKTKDQYQALYLLYETLLQRYQTLLARGETQIDRLEQIHCGSPQKPKKSDANTLKTVGIFPVGEVLDPEKHLIAEPVTHFAPIH